VIACVLLGGGGSFQEVDASIERRPRTAKASKERLEERRARLRQERAARIDALVAEAERSGSRPADRAYWSLVYDLELAPVTSNRRQLAELGVESPPGESLTDAGLCEHLHAIVEGLADLHTYLLHTDHLSDRELYERLTRNILDEPVHEICDGSGGREFIDLAGGASVGDRHDWLAYYASDDERSQLAGQGEVVPERKPRPYDRDRTLPRPDDSAEAR